MDSWQFLFSPVCAFRKRKKSFLNFFQFFFRFDGKWVFLSVWMSFDFPLWKKKQTNKQNKSIHDYYDFSYFGFTLCFSGVYWNTRAGKKSNQAERPIETKEERWVAFNERGVDPSRPAEIPPRRNISLRRKMTEFPTVLKRRWKAPYFSAPIYRRPLKTTTT